MAISPCDDFVCLYLLVIVDSRRDIFLRLSSCYLRRKIVVVSEWAALGGITGATRKCEKSVGNVEIEAGWGGEEAAEL